MCRILFEGGEDHETLKARFARVNEFLKKATEAGRIKWITWEGGDLKYLCLKVGLSGNFKTHDQCLWCEVPRNKLCSLEKSTPRTINSIRVNAHLPPLSAAGDPIWPFTCPCCHIVFSNATQHALECLTSSQLNSFGSIHKGGVWHLAPCTTTEISFMVPCVLHMRLRFVSTLWDWCIAPSAMVKKPEVAAKILEMLQRDGINTNRLRKINDFNDVLAVKNASFDGQGCDKVLSHFDDYLVASRSSFRELGYSSLTISHKSISLTHINSACT